LKHELEKVSTEEGIQIDSSDSHSANAASPKIETLQPGSNVTFERFVQSLKQDSGIVSMDEGMQIDSSDQHSENAKSPRVEGLKSAANVTEEIDRHPLKYPRKRLEISIPRGNSSSRPRYRIRSWP
jgi:hypothetical protein